MNALRRTACEVFGTEGPPLDLAGSTDLGILGNLHAHFGVDDCPERTERFFDRYHRHLECSLASDPAAGRVLEGVIDLMDALAAAPSVRPALLTGNTREGAWIKLRHFGLSHHFRFGAFGSDHADRNRLGPIALERAFAETGLAYAPDSTFVIGDTPKDIACAHAFGARCLAVATGSFTAAQLAEAGADWVAGSLREITPG
jgi:phosphoglycolate phosphatase-like HAD superfamily hydrolase